MMYQGSCHCGNVAFEVEGDITQVMACNCSMCQRKGALLWFVPRDKLQLKTAEDKIGTYMFNKRAIKHRFCTSCGIHPYGEGTAPDGSEMSAINVRCLDEVDIDSIPVKQIDGRSF
ncbi:MAG TPA: GFA family protein [Gammaproteobacteria bacterium]|nr:GFA family protein [Gammaproteobacteria bacterium]